MSSASIENQHWLVDCRKKQERRCLDVSNLKIGCSRYIMRLTSIRSHKSIIFLLILIHSSFDHVTQTKNFIKKKGLLINRVNLIDYCWTVHWNLIYSLVHFIEITYLFPIVNFIHRTLYRVHEIISVHKWPKSGWKRKIFLRCNS